MPNWVKNKVELKGESSAVQEAIKFMGNKMDFEKLEKCPQELLDLPANGQTRPEMVKKYGASDWYEWRCRHWGTKWNACEDGTPHLEGTTYVFDTAWSTPAEAIYLFSAKFPKVEFKVSYADEDFGYNCGVYFVKGGKPYEDEEISRDIENDPVGFAEIIWGQEE